MLDETEQEQVHFWGSLKQHLLIFRHEERKSMSTERYGLHIYIGLAQYLKHYINFSQIIVSGHLKK